MIKCKLKKRIIFKGLYEKMLSDLQPALSHDQHIASLSDHIRAPGNETLRCMYYIWSVKNTDSMLT